MEENKPLYAETLEKEGFKLVRISGNDGAFFAYRKNSEVVAFEPSSMKAAFITLPNNIYYETSDRIFFDGSVKSILETAWVEKNNS